MTTLRLAFSELKRMTRGTLPKLALIALTLVPLLYGALYLYANWDPQGNLDKVTAAVVNLDEGADKDGEHTVIGDDVVENLYDDGTFSWKQLDSEQAAQDAVASGEYAFALTLPKDFSAALVSPGDFKDAKQANLELLTNDANNFMVSNFANTLATEVRSSVSAEVGTETASAMIAGFVDIHSAMGDAADGANQLYDGTMTLGDGIVTLADGTTALLDGSTDLQAGTHDLKAGTGTLSSGLKDLVAGQGQLADGANALADGSKTLASGSSDLSKGLNELRSKTKDLPSAAKQLNDGAQSAKQAADQLADGAKQVADGNAQLAKTADDAIEVISGLKSEADSNLQDLQEDADKRLDKLAEQNPELAESIEKVRDKLKADIEDSSLSKKLQAKADEVSGQLSDAQANINKLSDGSKQVADGNAQLADGLGTLAAGTKQLYGSVPARVDGIASAADGGKQVASGSKDLAAGAKTLAAGQATALDGAKQASAGAGALDDGASQLVDGSGQLHDGLATLNDGVGDLSDGATQLQDGSSELSSGLADGLDEVPNPDSKTSKNLSDVIGDPVKVTNTKQAKANAYGEGLAPFFMSLATFIGILVLTQVMRPVTKRALASNGSSWKIALGGWIPFALVALVQTSLLFAVVHFGLGLKTTHPWMTWGLFLLAAICFSAIIQGIYALLGTAGKFLVLVLMVIQLVTAGGTFPWETLPAPLHALHQILPLSAVVSGQRHLMYGADLGQLSGDIGILLIYTVGGLLLSWLAVRKTKTWSLKTLQPELGD